ncbi:hypothetical protein BCR42DRAFT_402391 [Absidia repens]|uniref:Uncharacterized protein n=1 Tax=Absidia repens TaxID=90262 RepID=A0A1X2IXX9_9FUNG|nr:hypothetical protein BCR42DRAFT_402391 [Absidia repens]
MVKRNLVLVILFVTLLYMIHWGAWFGLNFFLFYNLDKKPCWERHILKCRHFL